MVAAASNMPVRLAESAFHLFSRNGFKKVNLDRIAFKAGVTKGSLYWHYRSKDELIRASCAHYYQTYHLRMTRELAGISDPVRRLEKTIEISVRICLLDRENRVFTTEVFRLALHNPAVRKGWQRFYQTVRRFYVDLVVAAAATGRIQPDSPDRAVDFMLATMEGIKLQAMFDPQACTPQSEKAIVVNLKRTLGLCN
jgi:AcrR family transcriptional regulator